MALAPRRSIDVSTTFANTGFARTRATYSETEWDIEFNIGERVWDMDNDHQIRA